MNFYKFTLSSQAADPDPQTAAYVKNLLEEWNTKVFGVQQAKCDAAAPNSGTSKDPIFVSDHDRDAQAIANDREQLRREAADEDDSADKAADEAQPSTWDDYANEPHSHSLSLPDNYAHQEIQFGQYEDAQNQAAQPYFDAILAEGRQLNEHRNRERLNGPTGKTWIWRL